MLQKTNGIVLRSVKYGESSLITSIFTRTHGVQSFMVKGVRSARSKQNKAAFFQPGMILDMVVYQQPNKNLQHIREYQSAYIYSTLQQEVIKNSVLLFSAEVLLRLLPENAPAPDLFEFVYEYLVRLDKTDTSRVANFPIYFIIRCSRETGYDIKGTYSRETPYLDLHEGGFTGNAPATLPYVTEDDGIIVSRILAMTDTDELTQADMNSETRMRIIDWYIAFLQRHTQHMGNIRSLAVLRTILH